MVGWGALSPCRAFFFSARKFDQKGKKQIVIGLGHEQGHIYKRQWPLPFTYRKELSFWPNQSILHYGANSHCDFSMYSGLHLDKIYLTLT